MTTTASLDDLLSELSQALWKQRALIDLLQYRLEVQQLVFASGNQNRVQVAVTEVEQAMDGIRRGERERDAVVRRCANGLGLAPTASLAELRAAVDPPWAEILSDHQEALLAQVRATEELAALNREAAQRGAADRRALLDAISDQPRAVSGYGPVPGGRRNVTPAMIDREV
ncbi:MAG: flagellar export chaperone FlgN [Microthrixaceae bacterium]